MITVVSFAFVSDESGVNFKIHLMSLSEMQLLLWGSYGTYSLKPKGYCLVYSEKADAFSFFHVKDNTAAMHNVC